MRRKLVSLAVVALFAACGFPSVQYDQGGADGGGDASPRPDGPAGAEGSGDDGAGPDGMTGGDGSGGDGGDATSSGDDGSAGDGGDSSTGSDGALADGDATADGPTDASKEAGDSSVVDAPTDTAADALDCDEDKDGYLSNSAACKGNDCCDTDNRAHPGQGTFFTSTDACGSYDYNCNSKNDPEYLANLKCGGLGATGCTGGSAFISSDPGCGNSGLYGTCVPNGALACQAGNEMTVTQGCN
ncbi:MAG TPA: hypothetical protein VHS09_08700 [Polyangiaceae bacterium]|nr:hypothetical protein [Polyangiaceae bacterium]